MIVHQDEWIVVVDKPSGVPTQATRAGEQGVYEQLGTRFSYVGLHHRLDRPVSGLLVLSCHQDANRGLARAFSRHEIRRTYAAILYGSAESGRWDRPLAGKAARTEVERVRQARGLTEVLVRLRTGRKHQIRQHAALAGTPVVGDRRYGGDAARRWPRIALHAARLELVHPVTGEPLVLESPIPDDLAALWAELR